MNTLAVIDDLRIFEVRGQAVALDSDLAAIYGVETKVFNQPIRRNAARFPLDFLFRLTAEECTGLRSQIVTLKTGGRGEHRKYLRLAFTEHGAIMAATILNSRRAVAMSVYVVRAFVRLRNELLGNTTLEKRLAHIEKTLIAHNGGLSNVYEKMRPFAQPEPLKAADRTPYGQDQRGARFHACMSEQAFCVADSLRIVQVRGQAVVLDSDLAAIYGVETRQLNRAIKRNADRFPADFTYSLTKKEVIDLKFQFGTSSSHLACKDFPRHHRLSLWSRNDA